MGLASETDGAKLKSCNPDTHSAHSSTLVPKINVHKWDKTPNDGEIHSYFMKEFHCIKPHRQRQRVDIKDGQTDK